MITNTNDNSTPCGTCAFAALQFSVQICKKKERSDQVINKIVNLSPMSYPEKSSSFTLEKKLFICTNHLAKIIHQAHIRQNIQNQFSSTEEESKSDFENLTPNKQHKLNPYTNFATDLKSNREDLYRLITLKLQQQYKCKSDKYFPDFLEHLKQANYPMPVGFQKDKNCLNQSFHYIAQSADWQNHPGCNLQEIRSKTFSHYTDNLTPNPELLSQKESLSNSILTSDRQGQLLIIAADMTSYGRQYEVHCCVFLGTFFHPDLKEQFIVMFDPNGNSFQRELAFYLDDITNDDRGFPTKIPTTKVHQISIKTLTEKQLLPLLVRFIPEKELIALIKKGHSQDGFPNSGIYQLNKNPKKEQCLIM